MTKTNGISGIARKMLYDIKRRYEPVLCPTAAKFDPIFVASTLLSPPYHLLLNESQIIAAKSFILSMIRRDKPVSPEVTNSECGGSHSHTTASDNEQDEPEPPKKRFKHLSRVSTLLETEESLHNASEVPIQISQEERELDQYRKMKLNKNDLKEDPFDFWISHETSFPLLFHTACELFSTPASSAPVERVFSYSGDVTKGKRLSDYNLEREILIRKNKDYL